MNLYKLENEYQTLLDMLESEDASEEAIKETMAMILLDIDDKAENYGKVLEQLKADAEALKQAKLRIAKKQAAIENGIDRLRSALLSVMLLTGRSKIKTPLYTFSATSRWKAVLDVADDQVPDEFKKVTVKADTAAIEKWLKSFNRDEGGNNCTTCEWAHLEQVESLTVR